LDIKDETQKLLTTAHVEGNSISQMASKCGDGEKTKRKVEDVHRFTYLNNVFPKDSCPLPNIESLVDNASYCSLLSFMERFSGYNQIRMQPRDEEKTVFMAEVANYCYAGAT